MLAKANTHRSTSPTLVGVSCLGLALLSACNPKQDQITPDPVITYSLSGKIYLTSTNSGKGKMKQEKPLNLVSNSIITGSYLVKFKDIAPKKIRVAGQTLIRQWATQQLGIAAYKVASSHFKASQYTTGQISTMSLSQSSLIAQKLLENSFVIEVVPDSYISSQGQQIQPANTQPQKIISSQTISNEPNDTLWPKQWEAPLINLPAAWNKSTGKDIVVAVIDTGIIAHPDLQGQYLQGIDVISNIAHSKDGDGVDNDPTDDDPDSDFHGAHVAGILAAKSNNAIGRAGTASNAKILPVRALAAKGGSRVDIILGVIWAAGIKINSLVLDPISQEPIPLPNWIYKNPHPAHIINMSLGSEEWCDPISSNIFTTLANKGVFVVAAAGNKNKPASMYYPASCLGVITVGALNKQGLKASYSNYGSVIDIMVGGGGSGIERDKDGNDINPKGIWSTVKNPATGKFDYFPYSGTSMAAPQVSGALALLLSQKPNLSYKQVSNLLKNSAELIDNCPKNCGAGKLNVDLLLSNAINVVPELPDRTSPIKVRAFPSKATNNTLATQFNNISRSQHSDNAIRYSFQTKQADAYTVYAWQDTNKNGQIDLLEPFGISKIKAIVNSEQSSINNVDIILAPINQTQLSDPFIIKIR